MGVRAEPKPGRANITSGTDENNVLSVKPVFDYLRRLVRQSSTSVFAIGFTTNGGGRRTLDV